MRPRPRSSTGRTRSPRFAPSAGRLRCPPCSLPPRPRPCSSTASRDWVSSGRGRAGQWLCSGTPPTRWSRTSARAQLRRSRTPRHCCRVAWRWRAVRLARGLCGGAAPKGAHVPTGVLALCPPGALNPHCAARSDDARQSGCGAPLSHGVLAAPPCPAARRTHRLRLRRRLVPGTPPAPAQPRAPPHGAERHAVRRAGRRHSHVGLRHGLPDGCAG